MVGQRQAVYRELALAPVAAGLRNHLTDVVAELKAARPDLDTTRIDNFTRLICLEEGYPCQGL